MSPDPESLIDAAAKAAVLAGHYLHDRFREGVVARTKAYAHDVVTEADSHAEAMIRDALLAAAPTSGLLGEESGRYGAVDGEIQWAVDPIDGTYNFVRGIPLFCVSIGVSVAGRPVGGCIYDPVHDELFTAANGMLRINGRGVARTGDSSAAPLVLCDIPTAGIDVVPGESRLLENLLAVSADVRRIGSSALSLAYVAAGRADLAANADVFPWDVAAGRVLVAAAGGGFVDVPDQARVDQPGGFVAWAPGREELGQRVAAALAALPTQQG